MATPASAAYSQIERWELIPIDGYENYSISSFGRVKNNSTLKLLKLNETKKGYYHATIYNSNNNKPKTFKVHRLVAMTYLDNHLNKKQVNHIDGNKKNNHVSNLEWCTQSENQIHAYNTGLNKGKAGIEHPGYGKTRGNSFRAKIVLNLLNGVFYDCAKDAADSIDMKYSTFKSAIRRKTNRAKNFIYV